MKRQYFTQFLILILLTIFTQNSFAQDKKSEIPRDIRFLAELQIVLSKNLPDSSKSALLDSLMTAEQYSWDDVNKMYQNRFQKNADKTIANIKLIEQYLTEEMKRIQKAGEKKAFSDMDKKTRPKQPGNNKSN